MSEHDISQDSSGATVKHVDSQELKKVKPIIGDDLWEIKLINQEYASSKVGTTHNINYKPPEAKTPIQTEKLRFKEGAQSKINTLREEPYIPGGGQKHIGGEEMWEVKLINEEYSKQKVDTKANINYKGISSKKKIYNEKLHFREMAKSRYSHLSHQSKEGAASSTSRKDSLSTKGKAD